MSENLANQTCEPCKGNIPPLTDDEAYSLLKELGKGWRINMNRHLEKNLASKDFITSLKIANEIAVIAETEGHHPVLEVSYGNLKIEIWTHKIGDLTKADFILAAKLEVLFETE